MVQTILPHRAYALDHVGTHDNKQVGTHHGSGNDEQGCGQLGRKGQGHQHGTGDESDVPAGHPSQTDEGAARGGVDGGGRCAGDPAEQDSGPVGI